MIGKFDVRTFEALFGIGSIIIFGILFFTTYSIDAGYNDFSEKYPLTIQLSKVALGVFLAVSYIYLKDHLDRARERKLLNAREVMTLLSTYLKKLQSKIVKPDGQITILGLFWDEEIDKIKVESYIASIKSILENDSFTLKIIDGANETTTKDFFFLKTNLPIIIFLYEQFAKDETDLPRKIQALPEINKLKSMFEIASKYV